MISQEDIRKGKEVYEEMFGEEFSRKAEEKRSRFPTWQEWTQGILFGQVWSRTELDKKTRSLCTVAALTVMYRPEQLSVHVSGALNNGATVEEIVEIIMQMGFYGGWPVAVTALNVADKVFKEKGV